MSGIDVVLVDRDQEGADKGKQFTIDEQTKRVKRKKSTQEKADAIIARIDATTDYSKLKDVDLIVEAVFENSELKAKITKMAEDVIGKTAIFGSNTSTIPISDLAKASSRPDNFIGIHFFSPVHKMMLVEIIKGKKTSDYAISRAIDFVTKIRKVPIVVEDTRGFYANRCVMRYIQEGYNMLSEGVKPALIENCGKMAGMPVGPLSLQDEVALDLAYKVIGLSLDNLQLTVCKTLSLRSKTSKTVSCTPKGLRRLGRWLKALFMTRVKQILVLSLAGVSRRLQAGRLVSSTLLGRRNSSPVRMNLLKPMVRNLKYRNSCAKWRNPARHFTVNLAVKNPPKKIAGLIPNQR